MEFQNNIRKAITKAAREPKGILEVKRKYQMGSVGRCRDPLFSHLCNSQAQEQTNQ
jgi:hypothetical protein